MNAPTPAEIEKLLEEAENDLGKVVAAINYKYECGNSDARQYVKEYLKEIESPLYYEIQ